MRKSCVLGRPLLCFILFLPKEIFEIARLFCLVLIRANWKTGRGILLMQVRYSNAHISARLFKSEHFNQFLNKQTIIWVNLQAAANHCSHLTLALVTIISLPYRTKNIEVSV